MKLTVKDRLMLPAIMPKEGSLTDQLIVKDVMAKIEITTEEAQAMDLKGTEGGSLTWDPEKATDKEVELTSAELEAVKKAARKVDEERKVTQANLELVAKILDTKGA